MTVLVTKIKCSRCNGSGIDDNVVPNISCGVCDGTGYVQSEVTDFTVITDTLDWLKKKMKVLLKHLTLPED